MIVDWVGSTIGGLSGGRQAHADAVTSNAATMPCTSTGPGLLKYKSSPVLFVSKLSAVAAGQTGRAAYAGSARNTGIFRSVLVWYSS